MFDKSKKKKTEEAVVPKTTDGAEIDAAKSAQGPVRVLDANADSVPFAWRQDLILPPKGVKKSKLFKAITNEQFERSQLLPTLRDK